MATKKGSDKLEISKRVFKVVDWILDDMSRQQIIEKCEKEFGVQWRQAERYYLKAHESFVEKKQLSIDRKKGYHIQKKLKLIRDIPEKVKKTAAGARTINAILDSMADIEGLKKTSVELTGKDGAPIEQNYNITLNIK